VQDKTLEGKGGKKEMKEWGVVWGEESGGRKE